MPQETRRAFRRRRASRTTIVKEPAIASCRSQLWVRARSTKRRVFDCVPAGNIALGCARISRRCQHRRLAVPGRGRVAVMLGLTIAVIFGVPFAAEPATWQPSKCRLSIIVIMVALP